MRFHEAVEKACTPSIEFVDQPLRVPVELRDRLEAMSDQYMVPVNDIIVRAIEDFLVSSLLRHDDRDSKIEYPSANATLGDVPLRFPTDFRRVDDAPKEKESE